MTGRPDPVDRGAAGAAPKRPPIFPLCPACTARLAEAYTTPGRAVVLTPDATLQVVRLAKAVVRRTSAPPHLRREAREMIAEPDPDAPAAHMLLIRAKLCTRCTRRVVEDWGAKPPIALTPRGVFLAAALVNELWWGSDEPPDDLADLRAAFIEALVDGRVQ